MENRAALLASHGYVTMALDYLTPKITIETGKMRDCDYIEVSQTPTNTHFRGVLIGSSNDAFHHRYWLLTADFPPSLLNF